jgi:cell cycle checkpoint protein
MDQNPVPIFSAVSNSAHQLYILLRCIGFAAKASVQITPNGIRFSAEDARVMQGLAFLDKSLFANYIFNPPSTRCNTNADVTSNDGSFSDSSIYPRFQISLSALLETLKIFAANDSSPPTNPKNSTHANAFSTPALLLSRTCTLSYINRGCPLSVTLAEAGITTTCELSTYELDDLSFDSGGGAEDIPLQRDAIVFKIIMRSTWLHNAITELDSTAPTVLSLSASASTAPFFALSASGGPFSESTVEFSIDKESEGDADGVYKTLNEDGDSTRPQPKRSKLAPTVTETFLVNPPSKARVSQRYRFALVRKALRAMAAASKVSIRGDRQGVLSLQFMIELGSGGGNGDNAGGGAVTAGGRLAGNVGFVDFRFVPLVDDEESDDAENE